PGLLSVHSRYGLQCSPSRLCDLLHRRLQRLRYLHRCFDCYRAERTSSRGRDRIRARDTVRRRVTIAALSVAAWEPSSTVGHVSRSPLQSRKVGFPDSGFDLGFPCKAFPRPVRLKRSPAYAQTDVGLPPSSSLESWLLRLAPLTMPGPPSAQSSFACHL